MSKLNETVKQDINGSEGKGLFIVKGAFTKRDGSSLTPKEKNECVAALMRFLETHKVDDAE